LEIIGKIWRFGMIVYKVKRLFGFMKRDIRMRSSDKNKRVYDKMSKLRKMWWHFKNRWD
jgi:hypothetical protein